MTKDKILKATLNAKGTEIAVFSKGNEVDYISLTDIAKYRSDEPNDVIRNWMRSKDTIEFLGLWEQLNNPNFKPIEFDGFKNEAGRNTFVLSPQKWVESTNAIGLISKSGRYGGGTYAHKDIAFERLVALNKIARNQLKSLLNNKGVKKLEDTKPTLRGGAIDGEK